MKSSIHRYLVNFALFQAAWFWGVLAPAGWDVVGVALVLAVHLKYFALAGEAKFILLAVATGSVVDLLCFLWAVSLSITPLMPFGALILFLHG